MTFEFVFRFGENEVRLHFSEQFYFTYKCWPKFFIDVIFFLLSCPMVMHKWLGGNSHELHNLFMSKAKTGFNHISFYFTVIKSHFSKELYVIKWSKLCSWKGLMFALNAMHFPKVSFCWVPCRSNWLIFYFEEPILNMYGTVGI